MKMLPSSFFRACLGLALLLGAFSVSGCGTPRQSDLPWNSQQPWENSPTIPGLPKY